ncbi:MAG: hypothetical protein ACN4GW_07710 [Desulforhopalus sp.]
MEIVQFAKQALNFQKTIFDNSCNAMIMAQNQTEKMVNSYIDQLPWVTEQSKKAMQDPIDMAKKTRDDLKKVTVDSFAKFEEFLEKN